MPGIEADGTSKGCRDSPDRGLRGWPLAGRGRFRNRLRQAAAGSPRPAGASPRRCRRGGCGRRLRGPRGRGGGLVVEAGADTRRAARPGAPTLPGDADDLHILVRLGPTIYFRAPPWPTAPAKPRRFRTLSGSAAPRPVHQFGSGRFGQPAERTPTPRLISITPSQSSGTLRCRWPPFAPMTPDPSNPNIARRHQHEALRPSFITSDSIVAIPFPSLELSVLCWEPKRENCPKQNPGTSHAEGGEDDAMSHGRPTRAGPGRPFPRAPTNRPRSP